MKLPPRWPAYFRFTQRFDWKAALTLATVDALLFLGYALGHAWFHWRVELWVLLGTLALLVGLILHARCAHLRISLSNFTFWVGLLRGGILDVHLTPRSGANVRLLDVETEQVVRALEPLLHIGVFGCIRIQSPLLDRGHDRLARLEAQLVAALPLKSTLLDRNKLGAVTGIIYAWKRVPRQAFTKRVRRTWREGRRQYTQGFDLRRK